MMKLLLLGHGRMGKLIEALAPEYGCEVAGVLDDVSNPHGEGLSAGRWADVDVAIDFSIAAAVEDNVRGLAALGDQRRHRHDRLGRSERARA